MEGFLRTIIFANGELHHPPRVEPGDLIIAADGGASLCLQLGLTPSVVIGDMDSLTEDELRSLESTGAEIIIHPARKDYTDLELALLHARDQGIQEVIIAAALGERWDQTLANLLLPASPKFPEMRIVLIDGPQEIHTLRGGEHLILHGAMGDMISLIPLIGDAEGVTTGGLEYSLAGEVLRFGSTRGVSNIMLQHTAEVNLLEGTLACIHIRHDWQSGGVS